MCLVKLNIGVHRVEEKCGSSVTSALLGRLNWISRDSPLFVQTPVLQCTSKHQPLWDLYVTVLASLARPSSSLQDFHRCKVPNYIWEGKCQRSTYRLSRNLRQGSTVGNWWNHADRCGWTLVEWLATIELLLHLCFSIAIESSIAYFSWFCIEYISVDTYQLVYWLPLSVRSVLTSHPRTCTHSSP